MSSSQLVVFQSFPFIYVKRGCKICAKLLVLVCKVPELKTRIKIADVEKHKLNIKVVPAIDPADGSPYREGLDAFLWLSETCHSLFSKSKKKQAFWQEIEEEIQEFIGAEQERRRKLKQSTKVIEKKKKTKAESTNEEFVSVSDGSLCAKQVKQGILKFDKNKEKEDEKKLAEVEKSMALVVISEADLPSLGRKKRERKVLPMSETEERSLEKLRLEESKIAKNLENSKYKPEVLTRTVAPKRRERQVFGTEI